MNVIRAHIYLFENDMYICVFVWMHVYMWASLQKMEPMLNAVGIQLNVYNIAQGANGCLPSNWFVVVMLRKFEMLNAI